jgi:hypothetical protein
MPVTPRIDVRRTRHAPPAGPSAQLDAAHISRNELLCQLTADARLAAADDVGAVDVVGGQVGERAAAAVGVLAWLLASQAR